MNVFGWIALIALYKLSISDENGCSILALFPKVALSNFL